MADLLSVAGVPRDGSGSPSEGNGPSRSRPGPERLRRGAEFRAVYDAGRRVRLGSGTLFFLSNNRDHFRFGITVTRKVGKAVLRNRLKRRVREVFRRNALSINPGWDIVINPSARSGEVSFRELEREILGAVRRLGRPPVGGA